MPKAKLKFAKGDLAKVKVAAHFSDNKLGDSQAVGNNAIVEINFKGYASAVEFGRYLETVTGSELKEATEKTK